MLSPCLVLAPSAGMGRGVFTVDRIDADTVIEIAPVLVMSAQERILLDQTLLHDYLFEWGPDAKQCCMALGYVPMYNHSYSANCEYEMDYAEEVIRIKTVRAIEKGEELFINYNGDWDNKKPVWFNTV